MKTTVALSMGWLGVSRVPLGLALCAVLAAAQDLEPTPERAVQRLVEQLVIELPLVAADAPSLAVRAESRAADPIARALAQGLRGEGFRIADSGDRGALELRLSARTLGPRLEVQLTAPTIPALRLAVRADDAAWVAASDPGRIVISGGFREDAVAATSSAWRAAVARVARDLGEDQADPKLEAALKRLPFQVWVQERSAAGAPSFRAWLGLPWDRVAETQVRGAIAAHTALDRRGQWQRLGLGFGLSLILWLGYLRLDFATRGYMTWRLRGLLLAGLGLGWAFALRGPFA